LPGGLKPAGYDDSGRGRGRASLRAAAEDRQDASRASASIADGRLADAEAWLAVATTAAAVEGREAAPEVRGAQARLRVERDRLEEARSGWRRTTMSLVHALPLLLQIFNDSEDERAALAAACAWARQQCFADAVVFLAEDDGRVLASDGWKSESLTDEERRAIAEAAVLTRVERPDGVLVAAPIRYGGTRIGAAAILGPRERRETMSDAVLALAAASGSAVRGRLTTVAISRNGDGLSTEILGRSPAMAAVRAAVARAAVTPFPVLIEGESGTGKELVARALHRLSARRDRRLATLNCAALSDELAEAELFGHTRGAFTGAVASRPGLFEDAHGGTLFLDEVGELSPRAQAKLLRALQEREIRRVGENIPRQVDVRVMAATNRPLADMVASGGFREDLLFRLAVVRLHLPALRERVEDVPLLAHVFWRRFTTEAGKRAVLGADAVARLVCHRWPGNVRELQNVVAGLVVLAPARGRVAARHVDIVLAESGARAIDPPTSLEWARRQCERRTIAAALARHGGRRAAAARELGITRQGLAKAVRRLRLTAGRDSIEGVA
jgi:DNA-binding NtrC family response regulator